MSEILTKPADDFEAVTPSDTQGVYYRGIYIGVSGDVVLVNKRGVAVTFKNAQAGSVIPASPHRVMATNTTATDLVGMI